MNPHVPAQKPTADAQVQFQQLFESSPLAAVLTSLADRTFVDVSRRFLELSGWSRDQVIGRTAEDLRLWVEPARREALVARVREEHVVRDFEAQFRGESGQVLDMLVAAQVVPLPSGPALLVQALDITERKQTDRAVAESEAELRLVWENALDGLRLTDAQGIVRRVNGAYCGLFQRPRKDLEGHAFCAAYTEAQRETLLNSYRQRFQA